MAFSLGHTLFQVLSLYVTYSSQQIDEVGTVITLIL